MQISRRNITDDQRAYLIGKRYKEEKKAEGRPKILDHCDPVTVEKSASFDTSLNVDTPKPTAKKIAEQSKVGEATVKRAEKFADAVDTVAENTGINPQNILSGAISASRKDVELPDIKIDFLF